MAARNYNAIKVRERIERLYNDSNGVSYERLMQRNSRVFELSRIYLKDSGVDEMIRETKKRAVGVSLRKIAKKGPVFMHRISKEYPYLEGVIRKLYRRKDEKSKLQIACEEAGAAYQLRHKPRTLKQVLDDVREIGSEPEDFTSKVFYNAPYQGLGKVLKKRFGSLGNGVMLIGVDYAKKSNSQVKREKHKFSVDVLRSIVEENSLTGYEKGACLFNALSLQGYDISKYEGIKFSRKHNLSSEEDVFKKSTRLLQEDFFEEFGVRSRFLLTNGGNGNIRICDDTYNCDLLLSEEVKNPFHFTRFSISSSDKLGQREFSSKARFPAMALYHEFHKTLSGFFFDEEDL